MQAPRAKQVPKDLTLHGDPRIDHYSCLNQRDDPEVIAYLHEENAYGPQVMKPTAGYNKHLSVEQIHSNSKADIA